MMHSSVIPITSRFNFLVDCSSESVSEGHAPGGPGQGAKRSDSGAIASICNAVMVGARMASTSLFIATLRYDFSMCIFSHH